MEREPLHIRSILWIIFASSFASIGFELALMRVFSISLWYHFAFMVISIAMLGIGASGAALSVRSGLNDLRRLPQYALLLGVSIPASYLLANAVPFDPARLAWDRLQLLAVGLYYAILSVPFFCFGLVVSTAYASLPLQANAIYASDLVGAGAGAIALAGLLSLAGPETGILILAMLPAAALLARPVQALIRAGSAALIIAVAALLWAAPTFVKPRISPYKSYALALQFPGAEHLSTAYSPYARVDVFTSPAVRFAPGLSLTYRAPLPAQTGIAVDAGDIYAMTDASDRTRLAFVRSLPSSLAYHVAGPGDVLIIEPHAGLAHLTAGEFGARTITALDSNPLVLSTLQDYGRSHGSPGLQEQALPGLGRTWLRASGRTFDLIDISLTGSWPSAPFGFSEDYRFTVEAFEQYLAGLRPRGFLSVSLYIIPPPRTELRLVATLAAAARAFGITDFDQHLVAVRSWDTLTVVMKRTPLSSEEINRLRDFARNMRFDLAYVPGIKPGESNVYIKQPSDDYARAIAQLVNSSAREQFMGSYLFDVRPATDERPFFHYYLKLRNIKALYRIMGEKWIYFIEEGYLLPVLLAQIVVLSAVLILLPLAREKSAASSGLRRFGILSYFAFLGIAYLFVETAFIQKMILFLGNPSFAASAVIASILASSGLGSALARRYSSLKKPFVLPVLAGLVVLYGFLLPGILNFLSDRSLPARIVLSCALVMPAGLLMGIPFPRGISILGRAAPGLVPWAWAVNGCFSVVAPILAVLLALSAGYQWVLFCGGASYLGAHLAITRWGKQRGNLYSW